MEKILLIEDDKVISQGINLFLTDEGYSITNIYNYEEFKKINLDTIDLVLLDINLPDINGIKLFEEIKKVKNIPIIFLTANDQETNIVKCLDMGADDYISKPFRPRELVSRMRMVIRRFYGEKEKIRLQTGKLEIDTARGIVKKNGQEVFLTSLEYRLLLLFFQKKGKVLSRDYILEELWDIAGEYVNDNTLTVYIKRLREKIEDSPQNPQIIKSVRGLGYKMEE